MRKDSNEMRCVWRETRKDSYKTWCILRETRCITGETGRISRDGGTGNLHLSGTVAFCVLANIQLLLTRIVVYYCESRHLTLISGKTLGSTSSRPEAPHPLGVTTDIDCFMLQKLYLIAVLLLPWHGMVISHNHTLWKNIHFTFSSSEANSSSSIDMIDVCDRLCCVTLSLLLSVESASDSSSPSA